MIPYTLYLALYFILCSITMLHAIYMDPRWILYGFDMDHIWSSIGPRCLLSLCLHGLCAWSSCVSRHTLPCGISLSIGPRCLLSLCFRKPVWLYLLPWHATQSNAFICLSRHHQNRYVINIGFWRTVFVHRIFTGLLYLSTDFYRL